MSEPKTYNPQEIEIKWQELWHNSEAFKAKASEGDADTYILEMFPYPSGRIHMGHLRNYTIGDAIARFNRAQGKNVLHPMGWDAFGLPAENAAIENKVSPADWTYKNIDNMRLELKRLGLSYDWSREVATCSPDYYQHEQKFFLSFLKNGLAYQKESTVNWDPVDNTVLANEQVIDGRGWRSGALVQRKKLKQWFLKISDFAEELLEGLKTLDGWPHAVKIMQEKWIGKSSGAHIDFKIIDRPDTLKVFTTRPDTIFGMSFAAIAPGHPIALELATSDQRLETFISECNQIANTEEAMEKAEKKGFDTGLKIQHPFIKDLTVPLFVANFILMEYGTGAIFGCPAHDERDKAFALKYDLPIKPVVDENGILINSEFLDGLTVEEAKQRVIKEFEKMKIGKGQVTYRLRDWGVSRQRYWGCPIPIIYCEKCGAVPVPEKDLPVTLPTDVSFEKRGNPLDHHPTWKHVNCPECGLKATRETDTFDTFFESSWYFARFASTDFEKNRNQASEAKPTGAEESFERSKSAALEHNPLAGASAWLPVDHYIGGIEHAVLHLLYARFFTRVLKRCGYLNIEEPFKNLLTQGMVCHPTFKNTKGEWIYPDDADDSSIKGASVKMSKSKKNVVDPAPIVAKYGADTARLFMLSDSPPERDLEWSDEGIDGCFKFLNRVWRLATSELADKASEPKRRKIHRLIADVTTDYNNNHFNKAVAGIRTLFNELSEEPSHEGINTMLKLLSPIAPHLAAELGAEGLEWPVADKTLLANDTVTIGVQVNGKKRAILELPKDASEQQAREAVFKDESLKPFATEATIKKFIYVPNRIINIVA